MKDSERPEVLVMEEIVLGCSCMSLSTLTGHPPAYGPSYSEFVTTWVSELNGLGNVLGDMGLGNLD